MIFNRLSTYLLIIALVSSNILSGQNQSVKFNHLDVEDGLPENTIKAMLQDSKGFMWFATWNGLCRYDGYEFKVYKHINGDTASLRVNKITCFLEDHEKRLWIGTYGGGLSLYNNETETFTNFVHDTKDEFGILSDQILTIFEDSYNRIWIGSNRVGVSLIDLNDSSNFGRDNNIRFIHFKNDPESKNSFKGNGVKSIVEDKFGTVWFGSFDRSIIKLISDQDSYDKYSFIKFQQQSDNNANNHLNFMIEDKFHPELLWVGDSYRGIIWFDTRTEKFIYEHPDFILNKNIPTNEIQSMLITRDGEYWFGTNGNGIYSIKPINNNVGNPSFEHFKIISDANSLNTDPANIINVFEDTSGLIWLGTFNSGIFTYQKRAKEFIGYDFNNTQFNERVLHIYEDKDGILWACTNAGIKKYDPATNTRIHFKHNPSDKRMSQFQKSMYIHRK